MSFYNILKTEYKKYFDVIKKILLDNNKEINPFDFESDYPLFDMTYNTEYYMDKDINTFSNDEILSMMKNTLLVNTAFCRHNNASLKTLYNMAINNDDQKKLIEVYINFLNYLISYKKISSFFQNIDKENIKIDYEQDEINNIFKKFNYRDPEEIARLIDMLSYNSIVKNYIVNKLTKFNINFDEEIKDFNIIDQLLHIMFINIPKANVNMNIYNLTKNFIFNILKKSKYLSKSMKELNNKNASKIISCDNCKIGKKEYELKFSYDVPDDITNIKTTESKLSKHILHIALYVYETIHFYLKEENYSNIIDKVKSFKTDTIDLDSKDPEINQFINKIHNFINKYSLQEFTLDNLINIFTIHYNDLYSILTDKETIALIKSQLYNISKSINVTDKKEYIDLIVDNIIINSLNMIKNNPDGVILFKKYLIKILSLIKKPNNQLKKIHVH